MGLNMFEKAVFCVGFDVFLISSKIQTELSLPHFIRYYTIPEDHLDLLASLSDLVSYEIT